MPKYKCVECGSPRIKKFVKSYALYGNKEKNKGRLPLCEVCYMELLGEHFYSHGLTKDDKYDIL